MRTAKLDLLRRYPAVLDESSFGFWAELEEAGRGIISGVNTSPSLSADFRGV